VRSSANKDRRKHAASEQSSEAIHELTLPLGTEPEPAAVPPKSDRPRRPSADPAPKAPQPPQEVLDSAVGPDFGATLRRLRERKGLSIHELATTTRISARWIAALEQEKFDQLPAAVFATGYVRNLARALGIDPAELLSLYRSQRQSQDAAMLTGASGGDRFETAMRQRKYLVVTVLAVLVGVLALLAIVVQRRQS
jgi:transcriptional regulator with XRE-family HTH domain